MKPYYEQIYDHLTLVHLVHYIMCTSPDRLNELSFRTLIVARNVPVTSDSTSFFTLIIQSHQEIVAKFEKKNW